MTITLWHSNLCADRYDYKRDYPKRRPFYVRAVQASKPGLLSLSECQAPAANSLAKSLGYRAESYKGSSILFDPALFTLNRRILEYSWLGNSQTHSLLGLEFVEKVNGKTFNVLSTHLPPFAYRAKMRKSIMGKITSVTGKWNDPTILCADANWSKTFESYMKANGGWFSFRTSSLTKLHADFVTHGSRFAKGNPIDYVIGKKQVTPLRYGVIDGRKWSDHNTIEVEFTLVPVSTL